MADCVFTCIADFEKYANEHLPPRMRIFVNSGADEEVTLQDNVRAYRRLRLRPRLMVDVSNRRTDVKVLGKTISFPVGISPTAMHRIAHPDGEVATARAAQDMSTIYIMSMVATSSVEEVAKAAPNGIKWLQLYIPKDRKLTVDIIKRAERVGFQALVLTVDTAAVGKRRSNVRMPLSIPPHLKLGNFGEKAEIVAKANDQGIPTGGVFEDNLTWDDIAWLRSISTLPIIVKGILTKEDAELALKHNVSAIFVSNHGGRQLDGCLATIDALPEIMEVVKDKVEVYVDGGIRTGTDVLKALALGAKSVFIGRPVIWGLSYKGYEGVRRVLSILKEEFNLALALTGCTSPADIQPSHVARDQTLARL